MLIRVSMLALFFGATAALVPGSCETQVQEAESRNRLRVIRLSLNQFVRKNGHLPASLDEICTRGVPCPHMPAGDNLRGLTDGWNRPFQYRLLNAEYELRSVGEDGKAGSSDDIVIIPSIEGALVKRVAGCYRVDFSWWKAFEGSMLILDTLSSYPGVYLVSPVARGYLDGAWEVRGRDSVLVEWVEQHSTAQVAIRVIGDSLAGVAIIPRHRPREVSGVRVACSRER
jgi:type II secretory pathway pseudopilin PulG